jgi:PAS domain S-box-containing protein
VLRDVSDRKRVEEQLREKEARYRLIVENQTEFIVKWRPDGTRTFVNEHYCRLFCQEDGECIGTSFFPLVAPEHRGSIRDRIASLTPDHPEFSQDHVSYSRLGPRWQQWTTRGIFDEHHRLVELLSTGRDITERKTAEDKLRQSQAHLLGLAAHREHRQLGAGCRVDVRSRSESDAMVRRVPSPARPRLPRMRRCRWPRSIVACTRRTAARSATPSAVPSTTEGRTPSNTASCWTTGPNDCFISRPSLSATR